MKHMKWKPPWAEVVLYWVPAFAGVTHLAKVLQENYVMAEIFVSIAFAWRGLHEWIGRADILQHD